MVTVVPLTVTSVVMICGASAGFMIGSVNSCSCREVVGWAAGYRTDSLVETTVVGWRVWATPLADTGPGEPGEQDGNPAKLELPAGNELTRAIIGCCDASVGMAEAGMGNGRTLKDGTRSTGVPRWG